MGSYGFYRQCIYIYYVVTGLYRLYKDKEVYIRGEHPHKVKWGEKGKGRGRTRGWSDGSANMQDHD